jgi:purine-binding chemotaxis protein CheW
VSSDRDVLEARARALARPQLQASEDAGEPFLTFALDVEGYAIAARLVVEVMRLTELTPLPGAVAPLQGITGWRGTVLTLIDLRAIVGLPHRALADLAHVLVISDGSTTFGLLADMVHDVVLIDARDLSPLPDDRNAAASVTVGLTRDATLVLDGVRLISRQNTGSRSDRGREHPFTDPTS